MVQEIEKIKGKSLISVNRLDLMAKYVYVESAITGRAKGWATELYSKHIEAFSGGSFCEPGNTVKNSLHAYLSSFDSLIESIQKNGFDPHLSVIPVSLNKAILDGAHRTAIAAYLNLDVFCQTENREASYDYRFFKKMQLEQKYIDAMATKYVQSFGQKCYVFCIWPSAFQNWQKLQAADSIIELRTNHKILIQKDIKITYRGLRNLMIQLYGKYNWAGSFKNHFKGIEGKVDPCFSSCEKMRAYIVELDSVEEALLLKAELRSLFHLKNHSIHSSDNEEETLLMTHLLFNENSVHLINYGFPDYDLRFLENVFWFKHDIIKSGYSCDNYIIDSSGILGLYGIRKVGDLDYLTINADEKIECNKYDDNTCKATIYYKCTPDELIVNPLRHCYAFGLKFISCATLREFKSRRNSPKDQEDIKLLDQKFRRSNSLKFILSCKAIKFKRMLRNTKTHIRILLEKFRIYWPEKIWHFICGKGYQ